ncbi:hypothetical protein [Halomicrobium mukohataei]|uniref:hypothetical protein n=1 Tax=Halomicrobium mukohataei TaxID=57705 RepID=UPI00373FCDFE
MGKHADYGQAILSVARGVRDDESDVVQSGIESMLSFHEQDMHEDNVVDQIMSVQATAHVILARALGYSPTLTSPFIPENLVEASLSTIDL